MSATTQAEKAEILRSLHFGPNLLLLPNIWDPIGARLLAAKGFPAAATASAAVSSSLGYQDGERIKRSTLIDLLRRIADSVDIPVSADIEKGFGESLPELEVTIERVIDSGVVGINIEDSLAGGKGLRGVEEQRQRIAAVRRVAERRRVPLVINARVDTFVSPGFPDRQALDEAATRAKVYAAAGADCIYPIGPGDEATVRALRERIDSPINILGSPSAAPLSKLREIGVNRVSFGPFVFRACLKTFVDIIDILSGDADYSKLRDALPRAEAAQFLREGPE